MKKLVKSEVVRDASGYFSTGLYKEQKYQELTLSANTHDEFVALMYEIIELVPQIDTYYLITQAGTVATIDGNVCGFIQANERKEIVCEIGDIISVISASSGNVNLIEKG